MTARRLLVPVLALLLVGGALTAGPVREAGAAPQARDAALLRKLKAQRLRNVRFEDASLEDVLRWVRTATGHNLVLKRVVLAKAGIDPEDIRVTMTLEDVTVRTLLDLVIESHGLALQVKGNVVWITTRRDAMGRPVTRMYGISHITWTKTDFIAPEINLRPSDYVPAEEYEPERIVEDDPLATGDAVAEMLQEIVEPGQWGEEGWSIRATDRYLVVRAPRSIHPQVARALAVIASLK